MVAQALVAADLEELDDEVAGLVAPHMSAAVPLVSLDALSSAIAEKRDEAKSARQSSGIEQEWLAAEEAYLGIDDANRGEFQAAKWSKPMSVEGPVTTGRTPRNMEVRSTAYIRLTARYVDAGAAKLQEILLPSDDKAFSFTGTPDPDVIKAKDDKSQVLQDGTNIPLTRPLKPGEAPPPALSAGPGQPAGPVATAAASPAAPPLPTAAAPVRSGAVLGPTGASVPAAPQMVPLTVADLAEENIELANKMAKAAETRIYDWMVDCQHVAEMRKVIFDSSRIGVGVVKGPFPKASRSVATTKGEDKKVVKVTIVDKITPADKWIDPWRFYPDPACGEDIHNGDYCLEQDFLSERQVRDLKRIPGYIGSQIDKALAAGPTQEQRDGNEPEGGNGKVKKRYEIWYYYGTLKREEMDAAFMAAGKTLSKDDVPEDQKSVYAIATMIGDTVVRASFNPLDSGAFPYHTMPWQRRAGSWAGIGVAEQCRMPQRTLNASTRAMLNNAGKSAGCQFVIDHAAIVPADGNWTITPDKIWYKVGDSTGDDVRMAITAIVIPNITEQLMVIVKYAMQLAEESTSIPLITQGQSGVTTPDTFGAAQLQDNNANQLLRSIGWSFDDHVTEPLVRKFYEWLLLDPDVPDEEKGDFKINAHGSAAMVERHIQDQTIMQMGPLVLNPAYGFDPKRWSTMWCKSKKMDPADFKYSEEEQERLDSQPPADPPQVAAAKIMAAVQREALVSKQTADQQNIQHEQQLAQDANALDSTKVQAEQQRTQAEAAVNLHEIQMKHDTALIEYATRRNISLDAAKAQLATTAMRLKTERDLNAVNNAVDLHKHRNPPPPPPADARKPQPPHEKPAVQVPGRAANGQTESQVPA